MRPIAVRKFAVGIDIIEIDRVEDVIARHGDASSIVYTADEITHCRGRIPELAARFAAKEAVMKALGTGVRGVGWRDIEVLPNRRGKPLVFLYGRGAERAKRDRTARAGDFADALEGVRDRQRRRRTSDDGVGRHAAAGRSGAAPDRGRGSAMKLVTIAEMRALEAAAVAAGIPESQLMEEAGLAVAQEAWMLLGTLEGRRIVCS